MRNARGEFAVLSEAVTTHEGFSPTELHPQLYVDISMIDWYLPRDEFQEYLRRLVEAGFAKRIMFGSDEMIWPGAIQLAIDAVTSADLLSPKQKRDILYNAAKFLRFDPARMTVQ
jgi:predicted TIM-barrel fold metal-dependent hydrolase